MKRKILWITNIEIPSIAEHFNRSVFVGGWLHQTSKLLSYSNEIELHITSMNNTKYEEMMIDNIYYSAFEDMRNQKETKRQLHRIIELVSPDIIHIWGTEYYHSLASLEIAKDLGMLNRTIVSIQGLVSFISQYHYNAFLPCNIYVGCTFKDFYRRANIKKLRDNMIKAGKSEVKALSVAKNCIGRTDWDYACAKLINPNINYYYCNEIMREGFYDNQWFYDKCVKHSVFFSQSNYPLKGFHIMLEAASYIKKKYPDFVIRVLGEDIPDTIIGYLKDDSYRRYLRQLIEKYNLKDNVKWLGKLNEKEMINEYCKCNIFVCSSSIENSSNSISEAMLLGTPVVASDVGGIKSMMEHNKEGIIYQADAPYMLAYNIMELFRNNELAIKLGNNARKRALKDHDPFENTQVLIDIYKKMTNEKKIKYSCELL